METSSVFQKNVDRLIWLGFAFVGVIALNSGLSLYSKMNGGRKKKRVKRQKSLFNADNDFDNGGFSGHNQGGRSRLGSVNDRKAIPIEKWASFESDSGRSPRKGGQLSKTNQLDLSKSNVYTIAFTGGPCAGKTTGITSCAERLKELGNSVVCIPEAATMIFSSGANLNMANYKPHQGVEFQKCILMLQLALEDTYTRIATINSTDNVFVLCDRGLMDGAAYLEAEQWKVMLDELGVHETDIKDNRYDVVINMTTAALGAEKYYTLGNNTARHESIEDAIELEKKIRNIWNTHPKYYLVTNDYKDFDSKINRAKEIILRFQGYPLESNFSKRYILSNNENLFERIVKNYGLKVFTITDTFISIKERSPVEDMPNYRDKELDVVYIRKRVE